MSGGAGGGGVQTKIYSLGLNLEEISLPWSPILTFLTDALRAVRNQNPHLKKNHASIAFSYVWHIAV